MMEAIVQLLWIEKGAVKGKHSWHAQRVLTRGPAAVLTPKAQKSTTGENGGTEDFNYDSRHQHIGHFSLNVSIVPCAE